MVYSGVPLYDTSLCNYIRASTRRAVSSNGLGEGLAEPILHVPLRIQEFVSLYPVPFNMHFILVPTYRFPVFMSLNTRSLPTIPSSKYNDTFNFIKIFRVM